MPTLPPNFKIEQTADGSPTLVDTRLSGLSEMMHHQQGALAESLFIYVDALNRVLKGPSPVRVISVGLGLGYNELLTLATICEGSFKIWSFESVGFLREQFAAWAAGQTQSELFAVHEDVARRIEDYFKLPAHDLRRRTANALQSGALELRGSFPAETDGVMACNLVYYDAYSNKFDVDLWEEDALVRTLEPLLDPQAWLATYAATGALNRALKRMGFTRFKKPGFRKRRESTLAVRDLNSDVAVNFGEVNLQPVNRTLE